MNLQQLEKFIAVAESVSLTAAAKRLYTTQPNLSNALKALEDELGTPLFDRVRGRLVLNAAGRAALVRAREALDAVRRLREDVARAASSAQTLRAGFCDPGPMWYALPLAAGMHGLAPISGFVADPGRGEAKRFEPDPVNARLVSALFDGEIDFAVLLAPEERSDDAEKPHWLKKRAGIAVRPFLEDQLLLSLPPGHRLARTAAPITLAEMAAAPDLHIYTLSIPGAAMRRLDELLAEHPAIACERETDFFLFGPELARRKAPTFTTRIVRCYRNDGAGRVCRPIADPGARLNYELACRDADAQRLQSVFAWRAGVAQAFEAAERAFSPQPIIS